MTNSDGLKYHIELEGERFGSATTIAHLAAFSFAGWSSEALGIYAARAILEQDWRFELAAYENEYGLGATATFHDGSRLLVAAWKTDPSSDEED